MVEKVLLSWSGGKDSALALHALLTSGSYEVSALLTTIVGATGRVSMHDVRLELLEQQAASLGLLLDPVLLPEGAANTEYEMNMGAKLRRHQSAGVSAVAIGDIFLEDLRAYREAKLASIGMTGVFPLWQCDTQELSRKFIDLGFKAIVTCVDTSLIDTRFVGRSYDAAFLSDLPAHADPCGENGEFHTFVYDGPHFREPIPFSIGQQTLWQDRFARVDLSPASITAI